MRSRARTAVGFSVLWSLIILLTMSGESIRADSPGSGVTASVEIAPRASERSSNKPTKERDSSNVAVWLIPMESKSFSLSGPQPAAEIVQRNKTFTPHVLVVQVGTAVNFPNKDPFFHNIFSLFNGKRFDLGLYESGSTRTVRFDKVGVSYLFCNIHPEMSAVVIAVETPYSAVSNSSGSLVFNNLPDGQYDLHVWYERSLESDLKSLYRHVTISDSSRSLGSLHVIENPDFTPEHKNKYGEDYVPAPTPGYIRR